MSIEQIALHIAQLFAVRQRQTLQTVGAKVSQRGRVLFFDVINGVRVERGAETASITPIRHFLLRMGLFQVLDKVRLLGMLSLAYAALKFVQLLHVLEIQVFDELVGLRKS